jgi:antitoxin component of MazEF toxin-antitoxin module
MAQKIITIGSSIGIVLPKPIAEKIGLAVGQEIEVSAEGLNRVVIERRGKRSDTKRSAELVTWAASYVERYRKDFEALADK